jgi:hypothetical protein
MINNSSHEIARAPTQSSDFDLLRARLSLAIDTTKAPNMASTADSSSGQMRISGMDSALPTSGAQTPWMSTYSARTNTSVAEAGCTAAANEIFDTCLRLEQVYSTSDAKTFSSPHSTVSSRAGSALPSARWSQRAALEAERAAAAAFVAAENAASAAATAACEASKAAAMARAAAGRYDEIVDCLMIDPVTSSTPLRAIEAGGPDTTLRPLEMQPTKPPEPQAGKQTTNKTMEEMVKEMDLEGDDEDDPDEGISQDQLEYAQELREFGIDLNELVNLDMWRIMLHLLIWMMTRAWTFMIGSRRSKKRQVSQ